MPDLIKVLKEWSEGVSSLSTCFLVEQILYNSKMIPKERDKHDSQGLKKGKISITKEHSNRLEGKT